MAASALEARIVARLAGSKLLSGGAEGSPACDLDADLDDWSVDEGCGDEDECEEEVVEVAEEDVMRLLDAAEPALDVCRRLFHAQPALEQLQLLQPAAAAALHDHGWAVLPGLLPARVALEARGEALALHAAGGLTPAASHAHARFTDASARGDAVAWLHTGEPPASSCRGLSAALDLLSAVRADLSVFLRLARNVAEYQCAVYPGSGAAYARHRDAFPDDGSEVCQRRITAVLYCNPPDWDTATLGGALRLHVPAPSGCAALQPGCAWRSDTDDNAFVDVTPAAGTLVLFLSGAVEHEVMPCHAARVAITAWCQ